MEKQQVQPYNIPAIVSIGLSPSSRPLTLPIRLSPAPKPNRGWPKEMPRFASEEPSRVSADLPLIFFRFQNHELTPGLKFLVTNLVENNLFLVKRLIKRTDMRNPDPNTKRYTSLAWAAVQGCEETFEFLLSQGHDYEELSKVRYVCGIYPGSMVD